MQCSQCGAETRPGMTQCPNCGASLSGQDYHAPESYRPPKQQSYIPGGAVSASQGAPEPPPTPQQPGPGGPRRVQGSLGRRLAQQSSSPGGDDRYPPQRGSDVSRRGDGEGPAPRGPSRPRPRQDDEPRGGFGAPGGRDRRSLADGRSRGRGYDEDSDSKEVGRYGGGRGPRRNDDAPPSRSDGRGRSGSARRTHDYASPPPDDSSEEMIVRRDESRSSGGRRRGPEAEDSRRDDNYRGRKEDQRTPLGGPGARRSPGPQGPARGPGSGRHEDKARWDERDARRYEEPEGYTDEERAARFAESEQEGYSEEYEARPRYPEERRGSSSGSRGPRSAPSGGRAAGYRGDERSEYGGYDNYSARDGFDRGDAYGRPGPRSGPDARGAVGYDERYGSGAGYNEFARGYPPVARGAQAGYSQNDAFDESSVWQPGGGYGGQPAGSGYGAQQPGGASRGRGSKATSATGKPQRKMMGLAFQLFVIVIVVVGLVGVAGPEFAPRFAKYLPFLHLGGQTSTPPPFATYTPGPTPTLLPNYKLFSSAAGGFILDYPTTWATSTASYPHSIVVYQFTKPNSETAINVERNPTGDSVTNAALLQVEVQTAQDMTLTEITSAATSEGIGGEIWDRHEYQATLKGGAKLHLAVLVCHHLGKAYVIVLFGSDTGFAAEDAATLEPMLRSFRFQ